MDLGISLALLLVAIATLIAYAARVALRGAARYERVERDRGSALLGTGPMNMGYWALTPVGEGCIRLGITANAITWASLALGASAGAALALGHYGLAAALSAASSICDALDGMVARRTRTASGPGEVLDAAIDRWVEFLFLVGLAALYHNSVWRLLVVLFAMMGSFMVSYASAKADALRVTVPRGVMRRGERAVYLFVGAALTPGAAALARAWRLDSPFDEAPMLGALALVAVVANVSATRRLARIAVELRAQRPVTPASSSVPPAPRTGLAGLLGRHQAGSFASTVVDFAAMTFLVSVVGLPATVGTAAGAAAGAVTNFTLGRTWIFRSREASRMAQGARYAAVSVASLAFNTLGEYALHDRLGLQYQLARVVVSVVVSLAWNFPLQRHFVFRSPSPRARSSSAEVKAEGLRRA